MTNPHHKLSLSAKIEHRLTIIESWIAIACLLAILVLSLTEIVARNFFHSGLPGASTLVQYLVLWVSFMGAVLAVRGRHIKIDVATILLSEAWRNRLVRPISFFAMLVCSTLFWHAARFWRDEWLSVPPDEKWAAAMGVIIPLGFCLLALHFALRGVIGPPAPAHPR